MTINAEGCAGRQILIVEDNFLVATAIAQMLETRGFEIIGPVGTVRDALALVKNCERIDGAVLDVNLHGTMAYPIVDALRSKSVPLVFMTGYDRRSIEPGYADVPCMQKPVTAERLIGALFG
jgi:CheY-like chemotaxis protein